MDRNPLRLVSAASLRLTLCLALVLFAGAVDRGIAREADQPAPRGDLVAPAAPARQTVAEADAKSGGCITCHTATDHATMHVNPGVVIGCTDCHGGNAMVRGSSARDEVAKKQAHVLPAFPSRWSGSGNPQRSFTLLNRERPEYVRFVNPGDYRVARLACGACHLEIIQASERSPMSTSAMFWGGASYNNGILPYKRYVLGESYTPDGKPALIRNPIPVNAAMTDMGILPNLLPLPAWETVPPADIFRVFERGGRVIGSQFPEVGLPDVGGALQTLDEPGRPDIHASNRGPGTGSRIAVPVLNLTKTRLNDPHLWFLGTNDQAGDYRSSGCTACHTVYANDRDPKHAGPYAAFGNAGTSRSRDPTIPRDEGGHPLQHAFTRAIPSSQCMTCHMHQPNIFVNSFYGYTMWDYESDAPSMWPVRQKYPTTAEARRSLDRNPEEAATRGKWSDPAFLKDVSTLNPTLKDTQFADYHGHGWNFRAVFKRDRHGMLLDADGKGVEDDDPKKFDKAVHLSSIHMDKGFACVDCHFAQDVHGNGHIYGEVAAAIEIDCRDCHGTAQAYPTLFTSGPAAKPGGLDMRLLRTQDGRARFEWRGDKLFQRSALDPAKEWEMKLVKDTVTPGNPNYNEKAARAKLMYAGAQGRDGHWGPTTTDAGFAHADDKMTCSSCHLSWTTSCSGCHLPIQANAKTERLHYEGGESRNYATYNPQVVRDDVFQLGIAGTVKGSRVTPVRSSSALVLSSTNANRERIYIQQPPISASGFSSQAFAPHFPHTERKTETKTCSDCHLSAQNDNNAVMAQLLLQGTNFVNFIGYNAWVGEAKHVEAVTVTEWDEPQAVIGSYLQRYAYPDWYAQHQKRDRQLPEAHDHGTAGSVHCIQLRGEYLYAAEGSGGMRVYDVASIANKGVSQRIVTAPFSPLGQDTHVASRNATCVALPTNQPIAPLRNRGDLMRVTNQEQPFAAIYHYAFITDEQEGLIVTDVDTLADGESRNNFLERAATWNPDGILRGARHIVVGGNYLYIAATAGLVVVDATDPLKPRLAAVVKLDDVRASALQFRYLFVTTAAGLEVIDVTHPEAPRRIAGARVPLDDAQRVYVARTYAYVAAGKQGLAIVDVERPEAPRLQQLYTAGGRIDDARDVVVGSTNASLFAYVADGVNGLAVLQLTAPDTQPRFYGFSPEPKPQLIAWRKTASPALALSKGLDRDRGVDETGGQIAVFGRIGSRPFSWAETQHFYQRPDGTPWFVTDTVERDKFVPADAPHRGSETMTGRTLMAIAALWSAAAVAAPSLPDHSTDTSVGTVNCASSTCHGSIAPWKDAAVLQNEYTTWSRLDKHAKAYSVLSNDRSRKIARNLGLPKPANESALCLDCHANNVATEHRGERFNLQDGVTCEACHGPAGRWIRTHVEPRPDHQRNVDNGLYDTRRAVDRARLCLSCHFGNADKLVTHRLMGAGHPRLSFELDTFSSIEPSHARPERLQDGVKLWAVGQALAVSASMAILTNPERGRDGLFPELVLFDCHACHHPMSDARWTPRTTFGTSLGPGIARLNDSSLLMMRVIARQIDPALGQRVTEQAARLQAAAAGNGDVNAEAVGTRALAEDVARRIDVSPIDAGALRGIALGLVDEGLAGHYADYAGAEQAAMAIGSVVQFMNRRGQLRDARAVNDGLTRLLAELADDERYRPAAFQQRLQAFRGLLARP